MLQQYTLKKGILSCRIQNYLTKVLFIIFVGILFTGCRPAPAPTVTSMLNPGESSVQLLPERSAGILHDQLTIKRNVNSFDSMPQLTIYNMTMHALTLELTGTNGSYTLTLEPKRDYTWQINQGVYHVEISIPGFPTIATDGLSLNSYTHNIWKLWKTRH